MKKNLRINVRILAVLLIFISGVYTSCGNEGGGTQTDDFDVQFELPALIDVSQGGECVFTVKDGKSPQTTDSFILESEGGISYICSIVSASSGNFTVRLANEIGTGYYNVSVKRDTRKKSFGKTYINIVEDIGFTPDEGTTVYGVVSTTTGGVENVVVSDGEEVAVTDKDGIYQLKSTKKWGYPF